MSHTDSVLLPWWSDLAVEKKRRIINDGLFCAQIVGMVILCGSQFWRFLHTPDFKGISLSMLFLAEAYLVLHFQLAWSAHKAQPSRETTQVVISFLGWFVGISVDILAIALNGTYHWGHNDNTTMLWALALGTIAFITSQQYGQGRKDPRLRAGLAILFKSFPQFMMAVKAVSEHGNSLPGWAVAAGNATIMIRIYQVWVTIKESPTEKNRRWLFISEMVNEISWISVTATWLWYLP